MMPFDLLWCEDCGKVNVGMCDIHGKLGVIKDRELPPMARLTLPRSLVLKFSGVDSSGKDVYSVYARKLIPSRVQLGPLVAPVMDERPPGRNEKMELMLMKRDGSYSWFDLSDEKRCSWMTYLRMDNSLDTHNAVVYQHGDHVYLVTTTVITPNQEVRVKYANHYSMQIHSLLETHDAVMSPDRHGSSDDTDDGQTMSDTETSNFLNTALQSHSTEVIHRKQTKDMKRVTNVADLLQSVEGQTQVEETQKCDKPIKALQGDGKKSDVNINSDIIDTSQSNENEMIREILGRLKNIQKPVKKESQIKKYSRRTVKKPKLMFNCVFCDAAFSSQRAFKAHSLLHSNNKPYACIYVGCDKAFTTKYKLERHAAIHNKDKSITCNLCGKGFNRNDHLRSHMLVHSQERKTHSCEECHKEYSSLLTFKAHMALHAADRGVTVCQICNRGFDTKSDLVFHIKVHSGSRLTKTADERVHLCPYCPKKFYVQKDVRRHLIVHTKVRDNLCQFCPVRFGRKDHLARHIRLTHGEKIGCVPVETNDLASLAGTKEGTESHDKPISSKPKRIRTPNVKSNPTGTCPPNLQTNSHNISNIQSSLADSSKMTSSNINQQITTIQSVLPSINIQLDTVSARVNPTDYKRAQDTPTLPVYQYTHSDDISAYKQTPSMCDANFSSFVPMNEDFGLPRANFTHPHQSPAYNQISPEFTHSAATTISDFIQRHAANLAIDPKQLLEPTPVVTLDKPPQDFYQHFVSAKQPSITAPNEAPHDATQRTHTHKQSTGYEGMLAYLETLRFLDNLPTNTSLGAPCESLDTCGGSTEHTSHM